MPLQACAVGKKPFSLISSKQVEIRAEPVGAPSFTSDIFCSLTCVLCWMYLHKRHSFLTCFPSGSQSHQYLLVILDWSMMFCYKLLSIRVFLPPRSRQRAWSWKRQEVPIDSPGHCKQDVLAESRVGAALVSGELCSSLSRESPVSSRHWLYPPWLCSAPTEQWQDPKSLWGDIPYFGPCCSPLFLSATLCSAEAP